MLSTFCLYRIVQLYIYSTWYYCMTLAEQSFSCKTGQWHILFYHSEEQLSCMYIVPLFSSPSFLQDSLVIYNTVVLVYLITKYFAVAEKFRCILFCCGFCMLCYGRTVHLETVLLYSCTWFLHADQVEQLSCLLICVLVYFISTYSAVLVHLLLWIFCVCAEEFCCILGAIYYVGREQFTVKVYILISCATNYLRTEQFSFIKSNVFRPRRTVQLSWVLSSAYFACAKQLSWIPVLHGLLGQNSLLYACSEYSTFAE